MNYLDSYPESLDTHSRKLLRSKNITTFLSEFFGLSVKEQLSHIGSRLIIPAGTVLYRARVLSADEDPASPKTWGPPPDGMRKTGRFNSKEQKVLYVATSDVWLPREINVDVGSHYHVAKFEATKDFDVLTLLKNDDPINTILHIIAMSLSKDDVLLPKEEAAIAALKREIIDVRDYIPAGGVFFVRNELNDLYKWTNKIFNLALLANKNGLRYCSAYLPFEISGGASCVTIAGSEYGNVALTSLGMQNIRFLSARQEKYNGESPWIEILLENTTCDQ